MIEKPKEILEKVVWEYFQLKLLNPEDDLLKYYILDGNGFRKNEEIKTVFSDKFGMGILGSKGFVSMSLQNYLDALENKVELYNYIRNN